MACFSFERWKPTVRKSPRRHETNPRLRVSPQRRTELLGLDRLDAFARA
jgi:hypothetical protein